ncbi:hypothetical protein [Paenibacillus xylanexedens]|uniref:hypothetical protein n=1 Tax=Paenibacillus xylanexedens TaxID=528191 RepID=UPI00119E690E|nr:hypothetical protein [Paenibacillus xylanexedens]
MIIQTISFALIGLLAVFLPFVIVFFLKGTLKLTLYSSPLVQLFLAVIAYKIYSELNNTYEIWGWILFYSTISSATLVMLFIIITSAIKGIRKIVYESTGNIKIEKTKLILYLFYFLTLPHLVFAIIYAFWGIVSGAQIITIYESIYFSFSLIYSLPENKTIEEYSKLISNEGVVQFLYILHSTISKAFEVIVVAFVASKFLDIIKAPSERTL